jgi:hypothetical protein
VVIGTLDADHGQAQATLYHPMIDPVVSEEFAVPSSERIENGVQKEYTFKTTALLILHFSVGPHLR